MGKAARWQGYAIRDGFGMTLIKNHIKAASPVSGKKILNHTDFLLTPTIFFDFGHRLNIPFCMAEPP